MFFPALAAAGLPRRPPHCGGKMPSLGHRRAVRTPTFLARFRFAILRGRDEPFRRFALLMTVGRWAGPGPAASHWETVYDPRSIVPAVSHASRCDPDGGPGRHDRSVADPRVRAPSAAC